MKLLEKLRARPEWQNEDAAVRVAAVRSMADDDVTREVLGEIIREDDDPVVRCEALRRIGSVDEVLSVGRSDPDETVRATAFELLRTHALETESALRIEPILAALSERDLALVSRSARSDRVCLAAVSKLTDDKWLGSVARGASRAEVAKVALARMTSPSDVTEVVLKTEDKTVGLLAFDKLPDDLAAETLAIIAKRARQKAVARRARARLTELEVGAREDEISEAAVQPPPAAPPSVVATSPPDFEQERSAIQMQQQRQREAQSACRRLCEQVDDLGGPDAPTRLDQIRKQWTDHLAGLTDRGSSSLAGELSDRFAASVERCEGRCRQGAADQDQLERLETLAGELEALEAHDVGDPAEGETAEAQTFREIMATFRGRTLDADVEARLTAVRRRKESVDQHQHERRAASRSEREQKQQETLKRYEQLCHTVEDLVARDALERQDAERYLREARRALDDLQTKTAGHSLPSRRAREAAGRRLRHAHTALLGRVRELRDFADWQRWANLGVQETLCAQLEALRALSDDAELTTRYREIMNQWRQATELPKGRGEELRERFQTAHDLVYPRAQAYLTTQAQERERNLSRRRAIVEEVERLATSTDWLGTVKRITDLQTEWKELGPVPRRHQQETWARFRAACNTFFTRRKEDLAQRKGQWAANFLRKQQLCTQIEGLRESDDPSAISQVREAQAEWKKVGPVRRKQSDAVWKRFRAACDAVFARAQAAEQEAAADKVAVREGVCQALEALLPGADHPGAVPSQVAENVRDIQQRWRQAPDVPPQLLRALTARFGQAIARVVEAYPDAFRDTELDPSRQFKRLEALCRRAEALVEEAQGGAVDSGASPVEILASRWRDALASNLMGAKGDEASRRRAAIVELKQLQVERRRIGQVPGKTGEALSHRFQRACDRLSAPPLR